jgi:hypothetical protein
VAKNEGVRTVNCEGTVFIYSLAEGVNKECDKIDDDMRELIGQCGK